MSYNVRQTEHSGSKKGRGCLWGTKDRAKKESSKIRRQQEKKNIKDIIENE